MNRLPHRPIYPQLHREGLFYLYFRKVLVLCLICRVKNLFRTILETNVIFADDVFRIELEKSQVTKFEFSETSGINEIVSS